MPYPPETFENTDLARLIKAFGDETEGWIGKSIRVTVDSDGKRRIDRLTMNRGGEPRNEGDGARPGKYPISDG